MRKKEKGLLAQFLRLDSSLNHFKVIQMRIAVSIGIAVAAISSPLFGADNKVKAIAFIVAKTITVCSNTKQHNDSRNNSQTNNSNLFYFKVSFY